MEGTCGTLAKTGPGDEHWVIVLAGTALLLPGVGFLLLMPRRRRAVAGGERREPSDATAPAPGGWC